MSAKIFIALLALLILAAYSNSFSAQLTFDSDVLVADARVHALTFDNVKAIFSTDYWYPSRGGLFRPVTTTSYLFNYVLLGANNPLGYHVINFLLHYCNVILVFLIALSMLKEHLTAFFTAALFTVHPVTTESVTNIAGRADLLSACSVFGGFLLYLKIRNGARARYLIALPFVALSGVFAKENAVVLIGLMALYDLAFRKERPVMTAYAAVLAALTIVSLARWLVFRHSGLVPDFIADNPLIGADFWTARLTAVTVIARDLLLLLWPIHLSPTYAYNQIPMFQSTDWHAIAAIAVVACLIGLTLAMYLWNRTIFFLLGCILLALLPTANLIVLIGSIMAERFLYLPLFGFTALVAFAATKYLPKSAATGLLTILILAFGIRTYIRNIDWQDNLRLWTAAARVAPNSYASHLWLSAALANQQPPGGEIDHAIAEGEKAVAIAGTLPPGRRPVSIYVPLGDLYRIKGSHSFSREEERRWYQKSVDFLNTCIRLDPDSSVYESLGRSLLALGENQNALEAFRTMQQMAPLNPEAGVRVGDALLALNQPEQAAVAFLQAIILRPGHPEANQRLADLYPGIDKQGCAIDVDKRLNLSCPKVHADLCAAYASLAGIFSEQHNLEMVQRLKQVAVSSDGCPAE